MVGATRHKPQGVHSGSPLQAVAPTQKSSGTLIICPMSRISPALTYASEDADYSIKILAPSPHESPRKDNYATKVSLNPSSDNFKSYVAALDLWTPKVLVGLVVNPSLLSIYWYRCTPAELLKQLPIPVLEIR